MSPYDPPKHDIENEHYANDYPPRLAGRRRVLF
jgi:hypothetical protein